MSTTLAAALSSLEDLAERTPLVDAEAGIRQLRVPFGRYGYGVHYRVSGQTVIVTHIFHLRETR